MDHITLLDLQNRKDRGEKISMLTCYDATFARILDQAGIEILLIGDSLGMVIGGEDTTLGVTLEHIAYHTRAVAKGAKRAHIVADMPFMSYQHDLREAMLNAAQLLKAGAHSVKLEGGSHIAQTVMALTQAGIPVMGHVGLTPQSVHAMSGYRIQGKTEESAQRILNDALAIQEAGAYALVLECIPQQLAEKITKALKIPTIGIGSGTRTNGQVLVLHDVLGLTERAPKFAKCYTPIGSQVFAACEAYMSDVRSLGIELSLI